jgi:8-amino-7-oxononanoate synthase
MLAALVGAEAAAVGRSTLHLFHDLGRALADGPGGRRGRPARVLVDAGAYPIAHWGLASAAVPVAEVAHHDPAALHRSLARAGGSGRPVVVADGVCPSCGTPLPVAAYLAALRPHGGLLVLDDTQGIGLLGAGPGPGRPWGRGGGGTGAWSGAGPAGSPRLPPDLVVIASLAKAFGAPLAAMAGPRGFVDLVAGASETRVHSSPPSAADLGAALRALAINRERGDELRRRLLANVARLRRRLGEAGLAPPGRPFPVQTLPPIPGLAAGELHRRLLALGVRAVPIRARCPAGPALALVVTAAHRWEEIESAAAAVVQAAGRRRPARTVSRCQIRRGPRG